MMNQEPQTCKATMFLHVLLFFFVLSQANISKADIPGLNVGHNWKRSKPPVA